MSTDSRRQKIQGVLGILNVVGRESEVFFALLEGGMNTPAAIAKQLRHIPRTSIYDILKTLQQAGLVSSFIHGDDLFYQVEHIEHVADVLEAQKRDLSEKQSSIRAVADLFEQIKTGTAYQPGNRFFEGKRGILAIHRELQNARQETRTIVDIASVHKVFPQMLFEDNLKDFQTYKIMKKDLMIKSPEAERYLKAAPISPIHEVKWLSPGVSFQTDTLIWPGHVAIIDYSQRLSGVVIDNPTIADTFVAWFEMMWQTLPKI